MEFADRLILARTAAGKTQEQVADACGISHAAISKVENGKTVQMKAENIFAIADFLGCDVRWLAIGEGEMHPPRGELEGLTEAQRKAFLTLVQSIKK